MHPTGRTIARCAAVVACAAPASLTEVIDNLRNWIVGLLVAMATLFFTIGGLRYLLAGGDPARCRRRRTR